MVAARGRRPLPRLRRPRAPRRRGAEDDVRAGSARRRHRTGARGRRPISAGSLALIVGVVCLAIRLVPRARRHLLWRVRDKLILSYMFIGVVPVLLVIAFFVVSGLGLFLNVASYLVVNGFGNVESEAVYVARVTALEIQRDPGVGGAAAILSRREAALAARYPGASMALVPTTGPEPCVGGPAAQPPLTSRRTGRGRRDGDVAGRRGAAATRA